MRGRGGKKKNIRRAPAVPGMELHHVESPTGASTFLSDLTDSTADQVC